MRKNSILVLFALLIVSLFMVACKQDVEVNDGVTCIVNGFVYDEETKLPLEGATVSIGTKSAKTNASGYFAIQGIVAGNYDVVITTDGYLPGEYGDLLVNPGKFKEVRGEDLAYYKEKVTEEGEDTREKVGVSGLYELVVDEEEGTVTVVSAGGWLGGFDSIGDATRYSQTILGIGLRPAGGMMFGALKGATLYEEDFEFIAQYAIPDGTGISAYYLPTEFLAALDEEFDPDEFDIPILLALIEEMETEKKVMAFRAIVGTDGSFMFSGLPNGLYLMIVDPFNVETEDGTVKVPQTICFHENSDESLYGEGWGHLLTSVISGYGDAGEILALVDTVPEPVLENIELLYIRAVDRSELPIESARDINMPTGGGIEMVFSKMIDPDYEEQEIEFLDDDGEPIEGTQFVIENDIMLGFGTVYVWNDLLTRYQTTEIADNLKLRIVVSSYDTTEAEEDAYEDEIKVNAIYHMGIASTNLYEYTYHDEIVGNVFVPGDDIVITMDQEIPEGAYVVAKFTDALLKDVEYTHEIAGDEIIFRPVMLNYGTTYYLSFKLFSADEVLLYSTIFGLEEAERLNIVEADGDSIVFATVEADEFVPYTKGAEEALFDKTNINFEWNAEQKAYVGETEGFNPYDSIVVEFSGPVKAAVAGLKWNNGGSPDTWPSIPVKTTINEFTDIVTVTLHEDGVDAPQALFPGEEYHLYLLAGSEQLQTVVIKAVIKAEYPEYIIDLANGLDFFEVRDPDEFDSRKASAEFTWRSEGLYLDRANMYRLLKVRPTEDEGVYEYFTELGKYNEKTELDYHYSKKFDVTVDEAIYVAPQDDWIDDLTFGDKVGFVLITYDKCGRMIQSAVHTVKDQVAPTIKAATVIPEDIFVGDFAKDAEVVIYLTTTTNELIGEEGVVIDPIVKETRAADVVLSFKPEYLEPGFPEGQNYRYLKITVKFEKAVTALEPGDLMLDIFIDDTCFNTSDKFTVGEVVEP